MFDYRLEHIMSYTAKLGKRETIGPIPEGLRVNVQVTGGRGDRPEGLRQVAPLKRRLAPDPQRRRCHPRCADDD
jgi:hypothetical protein